MPPSASLPSAAGGTCSHRSTVATLWPSSWCPPSLYAPSRCPLYTLESAALSLRWPRPSTRWCQPCALFQHLDVRSTNLYHPWPSYHWAVSLWALWFLSLTPWYRPRGPCSCTRPLQGSHQARRSNRWVSTSYPCLLKFGLCTLLQCVKHSRDVSFLAQVSPWLFGVVSSLCLPFQPCPSCQRCSSCALRFLQRACRRDQLSHRAIAWTASIIGSLSTFLPARKRKVWIKLGSCAEVPAPYSPYFWILCQVQCTVVWTLESISVPAAHLGSRYRFLSLLAQLAIELGFSRCRELEAFKQRRRAPANRLVLTTCYLQPLGVLKLKQPRLLCLEESFVSLLFHFLQRCDKCPSSHSERLAYLWSYRSMRQVSSCFENFTDRLFDFAILLPLDSYSTSWCQFVFLFQQTILI